MFIYGYDYIILIESCVIVAADHSAIFDEHDNLFNIQFHITASKNGLYYNILLFVMYM